MEAVQFHSKRFEEAVRELESDAERGLSADEAQRRVAKFGHNELTEKPRPGFLALLRDQFNNYLVIVLIVAALIALALGEYVDSSELVPGDLVDGRVVGLF